MQQEILSYMSRKTIKLIQSNYNSEIEQLFQGNRYTDILYLKSQYLQQNQLLQVASLLREQTQLIEFSFQIDPILESNISFSEIYSSLECLTNLKTFNFILTQQIKINTLSFKEIQQQLYEGLKYVKHIENLSINFDHDVILNQDHTKALCRGLKHISNLSSLNLSLNIQQNANGQFIFNKIQKNLNKLQKLKTLKIQFQFYTNEKTDNHNVFIFNIKNLTNLTELNLTLKSTSYMNDQDVMKFKQLDEQFSCLNALIKLNLYLQFNYEEDQFNQLFDRIFNLQNLEECEIKVVLVNKQRKITIGNRNKYVNKIRILKMEISYLYHAKVMCDLEFGEGIQLQSLKELSLEIGLPINLESLVLNFPNWIQSQHLEKLNIKFTQDITENGVLAIFEGIENSQSLNHLDLSFTDGLNISAQQKILHVIGTIKNLEQLSFPILFQVSQQNSGILYNSFQNLPHLTNLKFQINDAKHNENLTIWQSFQYLSSLTSLSIDLFFFSKVEINQLDEFCQNIQNLRNLKSLSFGTYVIYGDESDFFEKEQVEKILEGISQLKQLQILRLSLCSNKNTQNFIIKQITTFMRKLQNLQYFQLFKNSNLTYFDRRRIAKCIQKQKRIVMYL